ncbi:unnamed protein product [Polarella glacialis]|uniref:Histone-binding protein RBBP4-like N-terminal domain-containing protein n=1 Tax=Polarella glacialis TaxID=89957 RepID=A0A813IC35_POLGL|nr:unnamed protein product [Polarella glacialis]
MAAAEAALGSEEVSQIAQDLQDRLIWRKNAPLLYDMFMECTLDWPALSVSWLADEPDERCRLAIGTQTDGSEPCQVIVAELTCTGDDDLQGDPWRDLSLAPGLGPIKGFGCKGLQDSAPLHVLARLSNPTEVNRVASCPSRPQLIAAKDSTGAVLLFDYKAAEAEPNQTTSRVQGRLEAPGGPVDGFALSWSPLQKHVIASGGNDGRLSLWDVQVSSENMASAPLGTLQAHKGALNDLSFSGQEPRIATVSDDCWLSLWDLRESGLSQVPSQTLEIGGVDVLSVDWNSRDQWLLATSGKDQLVRVWDCRSFKAPVRTLKGHNGDVVVVRWCPTATEVLASCSEDGRVMIWDLNGEEQPPDEGCEPDAKELMFSHGGHRKGVSDFCWGLVDDFLMSSVSEDNILQIWQPASALYKEEDEEPDAAQIELEWLGPSARGLVLKSQNLDKAWAWRCESVDSQTRGMWRLDEAAGGSCSAVAPALNELAEFQKSLEASCRASFQQLSDRLELMEERQRRLARHCGFREDLVRLSSASSAPCAGSIKASWRPAGSTELYAQRPCRAGGGGAPRQPRPSSVSSATAAAGRAAAGSAAAKASAEAWTQTSSGDLGRVQTSAAPRRGKKPKRPKPAPSSSPRPGWDRLAQTSRRPLRASSLTGRAGPALSAYDLLAMLDAPHQLVF